MYYNEDIPFLFSGDTQSKCFRDFVSVTYNLYASEKDLRNILKTNKRLLTLIHEKDTYNILYIDTLDLTYHRKVSEFLKKDNNLIYEDTKKVVSIFPFLNCIEDLRSSIYETLNTKELKYILKKMKIKQLTKYRSKKDIIDKLCSLND
jgi:hypothetical protein